MTVRRYAASSSGSASAGRSPSACACSRRRRTASSISALRAAFPALKNPANAGKAVSLTQEQFRYAFANAVSEGEAQELYDTFAVAAPGKPLFQAALANLNPRTEVKVDTANPDRGPMLL